MAGPSLQLNAILLEADPGKRGELLTAWWLWVGLFFLGLFLILIVASIGKRRRQITMAASKPDRRPPIKDAWAEAGKRIEPFPDEPTREADEGES